MMMKLRWPMLGAMVVCLSSQIGHADLLAHWDFEEGAGTTAADSVGSNNGTFQGTVDPEWVPSSPDLGTSASI